MTTLKRDELAAISCMFLPSAFDELDAAERHVRHNQPAEALKAIREARERLKPLVPLVLAACDEGKAEIQ